MIILPPAFTTGKPHMGHGLYLIKADAIHRAKIFSGTKNNLLIGYDCHGLPTKCKIGSLKNKISHVYGLTRRFTVQAIKEFENFLDAIHMSPHLTWTTNDLSHQMLVDKFIQICYAKNLVYAKYDIQEYCVNCAQYLSQSEISTCIEKKKNYLLVAQVDGVELKIYTTKPHLIGQAVAIVISNEKYKLHNLTNKFATIKNSNLYLPIIIDDNSYETHKGGDAYMLAFCGSKSDYEVIKKYGLKYTNYICLDKDLYLNEPTKLYKSTIEKIIQKYILQNIITEAGITEGSTVIHSERSSCKNYVDYHYSLHYYININKIKKEILETISRVEIKPEIYASRLINWVNNAHDWCISRKYEWCSHIHVKTEKETHIEFMSTLEDINEYRPVYYDVWLDSALTWYRSMQLINSEQLPNFQIQGYDVLTSWGYYSIVAATILGVKYPFKTLKLTGLLRDASGKKYSKSSQNYESPLEKIKKYGVPVFRLWAILIKGHKDTVLDESKFVYANKVYTKLKNIINYANLNYAHSDEKSIFDKFYEQTLECYNKYIEILKTDYSHQLMPLIKNMYHISTNYIQKYQKSISGDQKVAYYSTLNKIVDVYKNVFEPIFATPL